MPIILGNIEYKIISYNIIFFNVVFDKVTNNLFINGDTRNNSIYDVINQYNLNNIGNNENTIFL